MADVTDLAAARREARRLRILANAKNRLKRITTAQDISDGTASNEALLYNLQHENVKHTIRSHDYKETELNEISEDFKYRVPPEEELFGAYLKEYQADPLQHGQGTVNYRIIIIMLLGLVVRYINLIFSNCEEILGIDLTFLHIDKIFVPFLIYIVSEYFLYPPNVELNATLKLVFALNNLQGKWIQVLLNTANYFLYVLKDMLIYFSAFVFLDTVFALFNVDDDYFHMHYLYKSSDHA